MFKKNEVYFPRDMGTIGNHKGSSCRRSLIDFNARSIYCYAMRAVLKIGFLSGRRTEVHCGEN